MSLADDRRNQIETMVESAFNARTSLCDKAHDIYQNVAANATLLVLRNGEERRVTDNLALIGHVLNKEVYTWSVAAGLYRCKPSAELVSMRIREAINITPEGRALGSTGGSLGLLLYYLREEWQHPMLGARASTNPTYGSNRRDIPNDQSRGSVFILKDGHSLLVNQPVALRMLKDLLESVAWNQHDRQPDRVNGSLVRDQSLKGMTIVITAPLGWEIPAEIKDHAVDMIFPGPNANEFRDLMYGAILSPASPEALRRRLEEQENSIMHAATGLKGLTFINSLKVSAIEQTLDGNSPLDIRSEIIAAAKKQAIKAGGAISYEEPNWSMDDVGGHEMLKAYLRARSIFFDPENPIADRLPDGVSLPMPKGVLMVGIPGCGKSLEAKAMASMLRVPLLTLDMGAIFTGIVGGSEQRVREALQLAEECAPCVLRIEEIEKALSGSGSSNMSDGGTTNRVFQTILNWLQEKESPVYVVATANAVDQLPPELLRKGRFDEIFFVDLPVASERAEIFRIHLRKWAGLTTEEIEDRFDVEELGELTPNFSGAEIEALIKDSLYRAVSQADADGTLGEFAFTQDHIRGTIGSEGNRTFRILFDSEAEKLNALRAVARTSWSNASAFAYEAMPESGVASVSDGSVASDFFASDLDSLGDGRMSS